MSVKDETSEEDAKTSTLSTHLTFPTILEHCRWRTTRPGNMLDRRKQTALNSRQPGLHALQFVSPFMYFVIRFEFQLLLLAIGILHAVSTYSFVANVQSYGVFVCKSVLIRGVSLDGSWKLQFVRNGCDVFSEKQILIGETLSFAKPVEMNGFILEHRSNTSMKTSVHFEIFGSMDEGRTWAMIGSSDMRWRRHQIGFLKNSVALEKEKSFDYRRPWPCYVHEFFSSAISSLCFCGIALTGFIQRPRIAKRIYVVSSLSLAFTSCVAMAGYRIAGLRRESFRPLVLGLCAAFLTSIASFAERFLAEALTAVGILISLGKVFEDCVVFHDCSNLLETLSISEIPFEFLGLICIVLRRQCSIRALREIEADQRAYGSEWHKLQSHPANLEHLETLCLLCDGIARDCPSEGARQMIRQVVGTGQRDEFTRAVSAVTSSSHPSLTAHAALQSPAAAADCDEASPDDRTPLSSLDQLYSRSLGVVGILHGCCRDWAAATQGVLVSDGGHLAGPGVRHSLELWMRRGFVKRPPRAIEKALTCYGGDVSRLVDVCRGRIAFESPTGIAACLEAMRADPAAARILRIKNYLHPAYSSGHSGGFRGVIVNLRLTTQSARRLGVEDTVCEVQLVTRGFAALQRDAARHSRYIAFRGVRDHCKGGAPAPPEDWRRARRLSSYQVLDSFQPIADPDASEGSDQGLQLEEGRDCPAKEVEYLNKIAFQSFVRSTRCPGDFLDRQKSHFLRVFDLSSAGSVFFTSKPLEAMSSKRVFQAVLLFVSLSMLSKIVTSYGVLGRGGKIRVSAARFSVLERRDGRSLLSSTGIHSFGLLKDGCRIPNERSHKYENGSVEIYFSYPVAANGYYFVTRKDLHESDPVRWTVEASHDNGSAWSLIGASGWKRNPQNVDGSVQLFPDTHFRTPEGGAQYVEVDFRPAWIWVLLCVVRHTYDLACFATSFLAATLHRESLVRPLFLALFSVNAGFYVIAGAHFHFAGQLEDAMTMWMSMPASVVMSLSLAFDEKKIVLAIFLGPGLLQSCIRVVAECFNDEFLVGRLLRNCLPHFLATALGLALLYFRRRAIARANSVVEGDLHRYGAVWSNYASRNELQPMILGLKREVERIRCHLPNKEPHQYNRKRLFGGDVVDAHLGAVAYSDTSLMLMQRGCSFVGITDDGSGVPGTIDLARPVDSLDQLYHQALCLQPLLQRKVQAWAGAWGGLFPVLHQEGSANAYVRADALNEDLGVRVKWGQVKTIHRAIEKAVRSYGQDVSKLVDVCRQCIVFEEISSILACLTAIGEDPEVQLVRVKNKLDPGFDAHASAGYRDVVVNLRLATAEAAALGVETHVCEVQLIPRAFADIKNDEGHKRYVEFRNIRGE